MSTKMKKVIRIISEHKRKKSAGQVEVIILMDDGTLVTRHMYPSHFPKEKP